MSIKERFGNGKRLCPQGCSQLKRESLLPIPAFSNRGLDVRPDAVDDVYRFAIGGLALFLKSPPRTSSK